MCRLYALCCGYLLPDEVLRVTSSKQRKEKQSIRAGGELRRIARK